MEPERTDMENGVYLEGSIGTSNPCYNATGSFENNGSTIILRINTTEQDVDSCIKCIGTIPWKASLINYSEEVIVYYNNKKVLPKKGFCGWETNGSCTSESDCVAGGCSGHVCESINEDPAITTCEYKECYDARAYGTGCGCVEGLCQWR
jgi:eight-cysteine-cluster-containing protein